MNKPFVTSITSDNHPLGTTEWEAISAMTDDEVDVSDIPEATEADFARATRWRGGLREKINAMAETSAVDTPAHLAPDVRAAFPTDESVNDALRLLLRLARQQTIIPT